MDIEEKRRQAKARERERKRYIADLKAHPENYIDREGLRAAGWKEKDITALKPLFFKGTQHGGVKYYYSADILR